MTPYRTLLFCPRRVEGFCWLPYLRTTIYTRLGAQTFPGPSYRLSSRLMQAPSLLTSLRPWQADDTRCRPLLFPQLSSRSPEMFLLPIIPQKLASKSSVRGQCPGSTGQVQESCMSIVNLSNSVVTDIFDQDTTSSSPLAYSHEKKSG